MYSFVASKNFMSIVTKKACTEPYCRAACVVQWSRVPNASWDLVVLPGEDVDMRLEHYTGKLFGMQATTPKTWSLEFHEV
jgi:hypothetical protein